MSKKTTEATAFISTLGGGVFAEQLGQIISDVATSVVAHGKKGKINITLDISRIAETHQVSISHTLAFVEPTAKGKRSEDTSSETPMHLNADGTVTLFANHTKQLFELHETA